MHPTRRVLVSDAFSAAGQRALAEGGLSVDVRTDLTPDGLCAAIGDYDALVVRSKTRVTADVIAAGGRLRLVGRAGVGVDNIDVAAATRQGVIVMNAPGGSTVTVAEHTFAMMLAAARNIPAATSSLKAGRWDKKKLQGRQLAGMTLGVVGLGRIGGMVVRRARAFGMKVVAYDPFVTEEAARELGVELAELVDLWPNVDVVSLHVPLTDATHHLVNASVLASMRRGSFVVNCARGGIIDEAALADALSSGQLGGAAMDVFEHEPPAADHPLFALDSFVCAPHLGASTVEAQDAVAVQLADQVCAFFAKGEISNGLNVASVSGELMETLRPWLRLARRVGQLVALLGPAHAGRLTIEYAGEVARQSTAALTSRVLAGLIGSMSELPVNEISARSLCKERGLQIDERHVHDSADYTSTIGVRLATADAALEVVGTVFGKRDLRIVRVDDYEIDAVPQGHLLVLSNEDLPGTVGEVGRAIGEAGINIGRIHLSRSEATGRAFSVINIDSPAPTEVIEALRALPHLVRVEQVHL